MDVEYDTTESVERGPEMTNKEGMSLKGVIDSPYRFLGLRGRPRIARSDVQIHTMVVSRL